MRKAKREITGLIFNIQKFSIHDGPGIRTVVFFKGCPLHCPWCANPESQLIKPQILRNHKACVQCLHCVSICPHQALTLKDAHMHINSSSCTGCKACVLECPESALELQGEYKSVQEILDIVLQDQVFYEEGGGITLSGGEFLSQPVFAEELLLAAKEEGLHTCCETSGVAEHNVFQRLLPYIDTYLFDIKHWDRDKHEEVIGISNDLPLYNLRYALHWNKDVLPRIPVIPDFNDSLFDARQFVSLLQMLHINTCQLLPFHQFGENKYPSLDIPYAYEHTASLHPEDLKQYLAVFLENGIHAFF